MIYNLSGRKIDFKKNADVIIDFNPPKLPAYNLEFLLTFAISVKNWTSLDPENIILIHDDITNVIK